MLASGRYQRECDASAAEVVGQLDAVSVAGSEQGDFQKVGMLPSGAGRVDYVSTRKTEALCGLGFSQMEARQLVRSLIELFPAYLVWVPNLSE